MSPSITADSDITDSANSDRMVRQHIDHLAIADPEAARRMQQHLAGMDPSLVVHHLGQVVEEVIAALAVEVTYGRRLAEGMGRMLHCGPSADLQRYRRMVREAFQSGPARAALFARHLVPVLTSCDRKLADRFEATTRIMLKKGTYTLKAPLETLSRLLEARQIKCAHAFLDLLHTTYSLNISYNRTLYLTHALPRAVDGFDPNRRLWQIQGLETVVREDERLADAYLNGLQSGLNLLSSTALKTFLDQAIQCHRRQQESGTRFLSLDSRLAVEACRELQVAVPLETVRPALERYLRARIGRNVAIRPLSSLSPAIMGAEADKPLVHCDGQAIYLPDEMEVRESRDANKALYKLLTRLEAGLIEFGTFELDAQKALAAGTQEPWPPVATQRADASELDLFLDHFQDPALALDLFVLFECGRIALETAGRYPGLFRQMTTVLDDTGSQMQIGYRTGGTLWPLYRYLTFGAPLTGDPTWLTMGTAMADRLNQATSSDENTVETSARLAMAFYPTVSGILETTDCGPYSPLALPFGQRLVSADFIPPDNPYRRMAVEIRTCLADHDIRIYRSDIQRLVEDRNGQVSLEAVRSLIADQPGAAAPADLSWLDLEKMACNHGLDRAAEPEACADAFRYREWDWCLADYLPDRTRVLERRIEGHDNGFYQQTLKAFDGLVKRIRYAFELLRPEELAILRQWREGDAFDYRALLDYALDRKAGLMPSDRLFIKRMKRMRDVAVVLLVDLSRSTANAVNGSEMRVLDVEKQAIVLLCEALSVIGDRFAIAGFSGTGPLGVDYYRIKDLEESFGDSVKGRIGAIAPQRSTRMGAAIRHAAALLAPVQARVRLIVVLGDGFPNDLDYKGPYAVEDTRRAVMEARAEAIHVKGITVNVSDNKQLDRLYGPAHHTVIGDVRDLPDRLVRVYSSLTRH
jgi:nitric oxide reductase NorD protein